MERLFNLTAILFTPNSIPRRCYFQERFGGAVAKLSTLHANRPSLALFTRFFPLFFLLWIIPASLTVTLCSAWYHFQLRSWLDLCSDVKCPAAQLTFPSRPEWRFYLPNESHGNSPSSFARWRREAVCPGNSDSEAKASCSHATLSDNQLINQNKSSKRLNRTEGTVNCDEEINGSNLR